jgi:hypothetical protein
MKYFISHKDEKQIQRFITDFYSQMDYGKGFKFVNFIEAVDNLDENNVMVEIGHKDHESPERYEHVYIMSLDEKGILSSHFSKEKILLRSGEDKLKDFKYILISKEMLNKITDFSKGES